MVKGEGLYETVIRSHKALCKAKNMGVKDAFGHDKAIFYGLALCGECGELANSLIKVLRLGGNFKEKKIAVASELADVIIYALVLAYVMDINIHQLVKEKCDVVIQRAEDGYYGEPFK